MLYGEVNEGKYVGRGVGVYVGRSVGVYVGRRVGVDVGRGVGVYVGRGVGVYIGRRVGVYVGRGVVPRPGFEPGTSGMVDQSVTTRPPHHHTVNPKYKKASQPTLQYIIAFMILLWSLQERRAKRWMCQIQLMKNRLGKSGVRTLNDVLLNSRSLQVNSANPDAT
ncbi:hypothetical protein DPMN_142021 [Dreissena polymorpha]|uniref:Uncharacterized protein n=1 Tax=Dreissena polymorpha TaxID=45954 RepID=A0A9D4JIT6_DREPO|nr:hypothetical protein DPMN_142021 [Dreissena polymorpha]